MPGVDDSSLAEAAQMASLADETPEGRSIVVLAKRTGSASTTSIPPPGSCPSAPRPA